MQKPMTFALVGGAKCRVYLWDAGQWVGAVEIPGGCTRSLGTCSSPLAAVCQGSKLVRRALAGKISAVVKMAA